MQTIAEAGLATLVGASEIAHRVEGMAAEIVQDYGAELTMVALLDGGVVFAADLLRALGRQGASVDLRCIRPDDPDPVAVLNLEGRSVLVVDVIMDSGRSAIAALDLVRGSGAAEARLAVLLDRPSRPSLGLSPDYTGFILPDRFVVGYGLADDRRHRERADIAARD